MRRPLVALSVLSCFGLVACQDGPTQTFQPAPAGAGSVWNNGNTAPIVDPGQATFTSQGGGQNKQVICNAAKEQKVWAAMVQAPIIPPVKVAQLDLAGLDPTGKIETWNGLTIEQAEQINCQSTNVGDYFGDGNQDNSWGDQGQVIAEYLVSNHLIDAMIINNGYVGSMDFKSRDGKHTYSMPVGTPILKDGMPYPPLQWSVAGYPFGRSPAMNASVNEFYDALIATFAPGLPSVPDCAQAGTCVVNHFGQASYMFFTALGIGPLVASYAAGYPTTNTIIQYQIFGAKILPYSLGGTLLKLDAEGVTSSSGLLGASTTPCTLKMGLTFSDFLSACVNVTPGDTVEYNKEVGALSHDDQTWTFNVSGVDLNFRDTSLGPTQIVLDHTVPGPNDISVNFRLDQSAIGPIANDWIGDITGPTGKRDWHGSGLVYLQYARNVQNALNSYLPAAQQHPLGDPKCLWDPVNKTGVDPNKLNFPAGCTGFEGIVTAAPASYTTGTTTTPSLFPTNALGRNAVVLIDNALGLGMKAGSPGVEFCIDANGDLNTGYNLCSAAEGGGSGPLFSTSFARVLQVLGNGNVANLPPDAQDVRFFWKQYFLALVQYMEATGSGIANETETSVASQVIDTDDLFFDSEGAGQFELGEYVDRRFVDASHPPTDIRITADVKNGIFNDYSYSRQLYRGENAIYSVMQENPSDAIAQEHTALLTNVFGSTVLKAGWKGSADGKYSAYQCATTTDPVVHTACGGQLVPPDAKGNPRLLRYPGAFAGGATPFALGPTPIKITATFPDLQQATVSIPISTPPYGWSNGSGTWGNVGSTAGTPIAPLIPWTPKQSGVGFPIPVTGTLNKFIETANLDFSGTTISANVDYDFVIDPATGMPAKDNSIQFLAVETTDFLGEVFLCQDPATGDLLGARMYDTVAGIENWFLAHPGAYSTCGIITTYSPYDNYADFITSVTNGVRLNITQGGGFGRVVDVTLFVPGQ
jgi:hypothetical protein